MDELEIMNCPHCGGTADLTCNYSPKTRKYFVYVRCDICGSTGKTYLSKDHPDAFEWRDMACRDAISAWNMRLG